VIFVEPNLLLVGIILGVMLSFIFMELPTAGFFLFLLMRNRHNAWMLTFNPYEAQIKYTVAPIKQNILTKDYLKPGSVKETYRIDISTGILGRGAPLEINRNEVMVLEGEKYPLILNKIQYLESDMFAVIDRKDKMIEHLQDKLAGIMEENDRLREVKGDRVKEYIEDMKGAVTATTPFTPSFTAKKKR